MGCTFEMIKDPQAILRDAFDWTDWLGAGETISAFAVTASDGLTIDQIARVLGVVSYRVSGGTAGLDYVVTCEITTSEGNIDQRSALYRVRER